MSCRNFMDMKYGMPMICGKTYEQAAADYEREYNEEMPEDGYYIEQADEMEYAEELAENFNQHLIFHRVRVITGYYMGFQFYVDEKYGEFDLNKESENCIDNEEARWYFDMYRSEALRRSAAEKRKISKWLYALKDFGFNHIIRIGGFSDGSAVYEIVN